MGNSLTGGTASAAAGTGGTRSYGSVNPVTSGVAGACAPRALAAQFSGAWACTPWFKSPAAGGGAKTGAADEGGVWSRCAANSGDALQWRWTAGSSSGAGAAAVKRWKSLRHPAVATVFATSTPDAPCTHSSAATPSAGEFVVVTEPGLPLSAWLAEWRSEDAARASNPDFMAAVTWGVYTLVSALKFLHHDCKQFLATLTVDSVLVTKSGDWKLAGFDLCTPLPAEADDTFPDRAFLAADSVSMCPFLAKAPERASGEVGCITGLSPALWDIYALGVILADVFAGPLRSHDDLHAVTAALPQLPAATASAAARSRALAAANSAASGGSSPVPPQWRVLIAQCLASAPRQRPASCAVILSNTIFSHAIVRTNLFVDELALHSEEEKTEFFTSLASSLAEVPPAIAKHRVLPSLLRGIEFGGAGGSTTAALGPLLHIASALTPDEYATMLAPVLTRLWESPDRATRVQLLLHLPSYVNFLPPALLNGAIYTAFLAGIRDTNALLREASVKALLHLIPALAAAQQADAVQVLAMRASADEEPAIRVNAVICLGRVAASLPPAALNAGPTLATFFKACTDMFPPSRSAALRAMAHILAQPTPVLDAPTVARRLLPTAGVLCLDDVQEVREAALLCLDACTLALRTHSAFMTSVAANAAQEAASAASSGVGSQSGGAPSGMAGKVAGALGWAVNNLASRIIPSGTMEDGAPIVAGNSPPVTHAGAVTPAAASALAVQTNPNATQLSTNSGGRPAAAVVQAGGAPTAAARAAAAAAGAPAVRTASTVPAPAAVPARIDDGWDDDGWGDSGDVMSQPAVVAPPAKMTMPALRAPAAVTAPPPAHVPHAAAAAIPAPTLAADTAALAASSAPAAKPVRGGAMKLGALKSSTTASLMSEAAKPSASAQKPAAGVDGWDDW